jgi:hypothetical protein
MVNLAVIGTTEWILIICAAAILIVAIVVLLVFWRKIFSP